MKASKIGPSAVWGPPQPLRAINGVPRSEWDAVPGGTGALARKPLGIQKVEAPPPARDLVLPGEVDLLAEGRLLHTAVPIGSGHTVLHCLTDYGFSGARSGNAAAKRANGAGIQQVGAWEWLPAVM